MAFDSPRETRRATVYMPSTFSAMRFVRPRDILKNRQRANRARSTSKFRLRFLDDVTGISGISPAAQLGFENGRRIGRDKFETRDHKFGIHSIARRLVNCFAAERAIKFVFVIIVESELHLLAIGRELLFFVEHDQLRRVPGLSWFPNVAPKLEVRLEVTPPDVVIARWFGRDPRRHLRFSALRCRTLPQCL